MKTNNAYKKRLRMTRKGKIVARAPGHNHFTAKASGNQRRRKHRAASFNLTAHDASRYL